MNTPKRHAVASFQDTIALRRQRSSAITTSALLISASLAALVAVLLFATLAAGVESSPLDRIKVVTAYESNSDRTTVTIQGILPKGTPRPTTATLNIPPGLTISKALLLNESQDGDLGDIDYTVEELEDWDEYTFTVTQGSGFVALFSFPGTYLEIDGDALIASASLVAPADLSSIEFAFVAPGGRSGSGDGVEYAGMDAVGNKAYSVTLTDVTKDEYVTGTVTFEADEQAASAGSFLTDSIDRVLADPLLYSLFAVLALAFVVLGLVLWSRRTRSAGLDVSPHGEDSANELSDDDASASELSDDGASASVSAGDDASASESRDDDAPDTEGNLDDDSDPDAFD